MRAALRHAEGRASDWHSPARVKEVFYPLPDRIVAAYYIEILAGLTMTITDRGITDDGIADTDTREFERCGFEVRIAP